MELKNLTAAEVVEGIVNTINDDKRGQIFRVHMQELIRGDFVNLDIVIGEWHFSIVFRADLIAAIQKMIVSMMRAGFHVAHDEGEEYRSHGGSPPGYG